MKYGVQTGNKTEPRTKNDRSQGFLAMQVPWYLWSRGHRRGERLEGTGSNKKIMGSETKQIDGKMQQQAIRVLSKNGSRTS